MAGDSQTIRRTIPKLTNDSVTQYRKVYNRLVLQLGTKRNVLDIGKSQMWNYSVLFERYKSLDINPLIEPDIVADIFHNNVESESFDTVLCNGMIEDSNGQMQLMVDEVYRILQPGGFAIFGMAGKKYPYDVLKYDLTDYFKKFKVRKEINIKDEYYFKICQKLL